MTELQAVTRERDRLRAAIWSVIDTFEHAVSAQDCGTGGQHVPYHGDFRTVSPSVVQQMRRWARDLREALGGKWPMLRDEYVAAFPSTPANDLDYLFRQREP